jgi:hypothetical protein
VVLAVNPLKVVEVAAALTVIQVLLLVALYCTG